MSGVSIGEHTARVVAALHAADQLSTCGVLVWSPLGHWRRGAQMAAFTFLQLETGDYESWKRTFDSDPAGRKQRAPSSGATPITRTSSSSWSSSLRWTTRGRSESAF